MIIRFLIFCSVSLDKGIPPQIGGENYLLGQELIQKFLGEIYEPGQVRCHLDRNVIIGLRLGNLWTGWTK